MEDVGCYFTEVDIPSGLEMGHAEVFYAGTGVLEDPVQNRLEGTELILFIVWLLRY